MSMRNLGNLFLVSLLSGATTLGAYKFFIEPKNDTSTIAVAPSYTKNVSLSAENIDFTAAAESTIHSVVHVKNMAMQRVYRDPFEFFFGGGRSGGTQQQMQVGTGSGVIISEDGYIVTNNHVIDKASELEVTLNNNKTYKAKLIGTDSKMDIALIKIESDEKLPFITFGDSENVKVGEWALAVGNPYNLTSTVTAGIISAKARDLSNEGLQSFIQTDAAVNPGNSGGALVNTRGELIGINTMISSPTGSYTGYSFAVPSNITRKIIEDLMQFGNVQRGVLGIEGGDLNPMTSKEYGIDASEGVYIGKVTKKSGAEKAGIKEGDVIIALDSKKIKSFSELTSYINTKRPDEVVNVKVLRDNEERIFPVKLVKKELLITEFNGFEFEDMSPTEMKKLNLDYGIKIKTITNENYQEYKNDLEGSIILSVDGIKATDAEKISSYLNKKKSSKARYKILFKNRQVQDIIM
ncbi:Do family serine endopeptidase [Flavobacterium jumunjinense]|jgi:serine protease Do